jgi:L-asparaginase/Glu-tRNA(Gln) amidotransferase subunit D
MTDTRRFQSGGPLDARRSVYVTRSQDKEFLDRVLAGRAWLNIYGCRTMGKSSLYIQYVSSLAKQGIRVIDVDIASRVGSHWPTGRDWVGALGEALAAELSVDSEILTKSVMDLSANVATGTALGRLFDNLLQLHKDPVVVILDEYDYIIRLDYCDDILFALREIQKQQAKSGLLDNLSICLAGLQPISSLGTAGAASASPITIPIEMLDFDRSPETVETLMSGFPQDKRPDESLISRVLELSGGQPLVTMELLREAEWRGCRSSYEIDSLSKELVADSGLGKDLQLFDAIHRALLAKGDQAFAALRAYALLLREDPEAHNAPDADMLSLFGLVRRKEEQLEIKGDLFRRRFDAAWTKRMLSLIASGMKQYRGGAKTSGKRICVINTGGTLGMVERGGEVVAPKDEFEFKAYFTALGTIAEEVEFINLFPPRDSINVFPNEWTTIAQYIFERRNDDFDGFVVAHGTDTMAFTASAVAFALGPQLRFPVVFTGAQTTPDVAYGDAHVNLYRACEVAKKDIPEVVISFGNYVYRAVRAQKRDDRRFDGFESPTYPPLAEITGEINVRRELLRPLPKDNAQIELQAEFEKSILIVPQFPGLEPSFFDHLLHDGDDQQKCKGIMIQTLGAGNVASEYPYSFIPFVERAYERGIPIIVTSQYPPDPGTHTKYTPAQAPLRAGAIHAGNLTLAAAVTKFRWVLAKMLRQPDWHELTPDKRKILVSKLMVEESIVGEF